VIKRRRTHATMKDIKPFFDVTSILFSCGAFRDYNRKSG
jgi:hypothetical protein